MRISAIVAENVHPRGPHPCIARRCGHGTDAHLRTPELEGAGETVLWCAHCRRHEVRSAWRLWPVRRVSVVALPRVAYPFA